MTWFQVDDGFWCHPKVIALSAPALALWVRAGSWCSQQLTDGRVPAGTLRMLGGRARDADELVKAGLWHADVDGWRFHDWSTYQLTREQVEQRRAAAAERVKKWRDKRGGDPPGNART